jgi:hypothetical protein
MKNHRRLLPVYVILAIIGGFVGGMWFTVLEVIDDVPGFLSEIVDSSTPGDFIGNVMNFIFEGIFTFMMLFIFVPICFSLVCGWFMFKHPEQFLPDQFRAQSA